MEPWRRQEHENSFWPSFTESQSYPERNKTVSNLDQNLEAENKQMQKTSNRFIAHDRGIYLKLTNVNYVACIELC